MDELQDEIAEFEDFVQSSDVAAMQSESQSNDIVSVMLNRRAPIRIVNKCPYILFVLLSGCLDSKHNNFERLEDPDRQGRLSFHLECKRQEHRNINLALCSLRPSQEE